MSQLSQVRLATMVEVKMTASELGCKRDAQPVLERSCKSFEAVLVCGSCCTAETVPPINLPLVAIVVW